MYQGLPGRLCLNHSDPRQPPLWAGRAFPRAVEVAAERDRRRSTGLLDAGIAAWNAKRRYDFIRPVTAVRTTQAGKTIKAWAGPGQEIKVIPAEQFRSYIPTPPFPDYVSGHSTFSAAAGEAGLSRESGTRPRPTSGALLPAERCRPRHWGGGRLRRPSAGCR